MIARIAPFAALALALSAAMPASAQADAAQRFLEQKHDAVERVMRRPANAQRDAQLTRMLTDLLDYEELSRRALSDHWSEQSEESRTEFVSLLRQLVERNYRSNLRRTLSFEVAYEGAEDREGEALVRTRARDRRNRRAPPVAIDYLMRKQGTNWRVVDLTVDEGLSMVQNYRRQFNRIIRRDGWDGLINRMRSRLEDTGGD